MKREELDTGVFITERDGPRSVYRIKLTELHGVKRGFLLQLACVSVFTIAEVVYLPLLYAAPPSVRLSIADVRDCTVCGRRALTAVSESSVTVTVCVCGFVCQSVLPRRLETTTARAGCGSTTHIPSSGAMVRTCSV